MPFLGAPGSLMAVWAFFDLSMLTFGVLSLVMSIMWSGSNDAFIKLTFTSTETTAGLALGIMLVATFVFSIGAIIQRPHVTMPIMLLNWILIADAIAIVVIATIPYVATLPELDIVSERFFAASDAARISLQDHFQCCGLTGGSDDLPLLNTTVIGGALCTSADVVRRLNATCLLPLVRAYDQSLNSVFTVTYGFMAAVLPLLLASLCVIKKREETERFKKIDAKRGGHGFV